MTGTFCAGWDRQNADEWTHLPNWWQRVRMIRQLRKEMRTW